MITLKRHEMEVRGRFDHQPPPESWDYLDPRAGGLRDLAMVTCSKGHTTRLTAAVHAVDHEGRVSPSYVCTVSGCGFHDHVVLEGWDNDERHRRVS